MTQICAQLAQMKHISSGSCHSPFPLFHLKLGSITSYCNEADIGPAECVQKMRSRVFEETKLTVSAGIAPNKVRIIICPSGHHQMLVPDACQGIE
jgi:nucleotidyltransferase/DNA polymerase involved in DNA repair